MSAPFTPSRDDGRSDRRVVYELVQDAEPETLFTYDDIESALQDGLDVPITRPRAYRAIQDANKTLMREKRRALQTVAGIGARVLRSDEHLPVALGRKERAEHQIKRGIELLRNTRVDELDPVQRQLHDGQLLIMAGIYQATRETSRRVARHDAAISEIRERLAQLEGNVIDA
jgi:hypothetical protein